MKKIGFLLAFGISVLIASTSISYGTEVFCTMQYDPVCGTVTQEGKSVQKTFGNSCTAGAAGAIDITRGECETPNAIGGKTDEHSCLAGAGYSWDETLSECVRPWETDYLVSWAYKKGITRYKKANDFGLERSLSRQEAASMIVSSAKGTGALTKQCPHVYRDAILFDKSLSSKVNNACGYGFMMGNGGYFHPQKTLTRAEAMVIIVRAIEGEKKDENVTPWYQNYLSSAESLGLLTSTDIGDMNTAITRGEFIRWINIAFRNRDNGVTSQVNDPALVGKWQLLSLDTTPITTILSGSTTPKYLTFTKDRLSTQLCNSISGTYSTNSGVITATGLISTLMACVGGMSTIESAFNPDGASYTIRSVYDTDGSNAERITLLTVITKENHTLTYKRVEDTTSNSELTGIWKFMGYTTASGAMPDTKKYNHLSLTFSPSGNMSAGFCNKIGGPYTVSGSVLKAPMLTMTEMYCMDAFLMEMEQNFKPDGATLSFEKNDTLVATDTPVATNTPANLLKVKTMSGYTYTYGR